MGSTYQKLCAVSAILLVAWAARAGAGEAIAAVAKEEYLHPQDHHIDVARIWTHSGNRKLVIILPPYGGDQNYYNASKLPALLAGRGIDFAVLFTEVTGYNQPADITRLDALVAHVVDAHGYDRSKVVLGGFSAGGYGAFRYALRKLRGEPLSVLPAALISVDAPLDIERWYHGMDLAVQRNNASNPFIDECRYLTQMYRDLLGGTPEQNPAAYRDQSVLTASRPDGGNAVYFKRMPMRLYAEPDMDFFVPYGIDYGGINASDQVSLAAIATSQGNTNVSLVLTSGKGYRADLGNRRLPHSWSIVDETELAQWIASRL